METQHGKTVEYSKSSWKREDYGNKHKHQKSRKFSDKRFNFAPEESRKTETKTKNVIEEKK